MTKHYIFFSRHISLKPGSAHEIHDVLCANAAANLGYSSVLVYPCESNNSFNPINLIHPFRPKQPEREFVEFFDTSKKLKVVPLPMPWPIDRVGGKWTNSSTVVSKYY